MSSLLVLPNLLQDVNLLEPTNGTAGGSNLLQLVNVIIPPENPGIYGFLLEDSSGVILLEDGTTLLLENQS